MTHTHTHTNTQTHKHTHHAAGDGQPDARVGALKQLRAILAVAIQTCIRSSSRLEEAGREGLWFPLLDLFIDAQQAMKTKRPDRIAEYLKIFRDLTRHVVLSMIECVRPAPLSCRVLLCRVVSCLALAFAVGCGVSPFLNRNHGRPSRAVEVHLISLRARAPPPPLSMC
jgi:hypothetical protein